MQSKSEVLVSIVIINYNGLKITTEFLESVKKIQHRPIEIIMVDNNSDEDPSSFIIEKYPEVRIVKSDVNLGSAGGNSLGIKHASGDFIFIVNNDTEITENLVEILLESFNRDPSIGVVCPKILYFDKPDVIQYAGYTKVNSITGRNKAIGKLELDKGQHDTAKYTSYGHGAAMMVKREVIEKVGVFPSFFFIYYEELDLSERITKAGYKILYQPDAKIFHKESLTIGKISPLKTYYMNRNRILFMYRNVNWLNYFIFMSYFLGVVSPKRILEFVLNSKFEHLRKYLSAIMWNFTTPKETKLEIS